MRALAAMLMVCAAASCGGRKTLEAADAAGDAAIPSRPEVGAPVQTIDGPAETVPEAPPAMPRPIKALALASGSDHTCALLEDHRVKCWGRNDYGQLGLGDKDWRGTDPSGMGDALPAVDLGTGRTARAITAGRYATCALLDDASVKCWGWSGQAVPGNDSTVANDIGDAPGEMGDALAPIDLGAGHTARAIAMGYAGACAVREDDSARCWGTGAPTHDVAADGRRITEVASARGVVARYDDGSLGALFPGPVPVAPGGIPALALAGSPQLTCAVFKGSAGNVVGCSSTNPTEGWPDTFDGTVQEVGVAELSLKCWRLEDGRVQCRGANTWAVEPVEGVVKDRTLRLERAVALSSGGLYHLCAILATGQVKCWWAGETAMPALGGSLATPSDGWPSVNLGTIRAP